MEEWEIKLNLDQNSKYREGSSYARESLRWCVKKKVIEFKGLRDSLHTVRRHHYDAFNLFHLLLPSINTG